MSAVAPLLEITWEKLPDDFVLDKDPVDNIAQPALAAALSESLNLAGRLPASALTTTNYGICVTVNHQRVVKAPDWGYVPAIRVPRAEVERSYTPHLEGDNLLIVMEFLSDEPGGEYDASARYPYGKWFFYEQILQVPWYAIFDPHRGVLEVYRLDDLDHYQLQEPDNEGRYWIDALRLTLGAWYGHRETRTGYWLRWWDENGDLLLWGTERVEQEQQRAERLQQRAEQERQRAEQERQRAEEAQRHAEEAQRHAEQAERIRREAIPRLLAVGLTVEQVAEALGLTAEEVRSGSA
jgi:hypothetical protein